MNMDNAIEIFKSSDNKIELKVKFGSDTVWLSQEQLIVLFERNQSVISRHINNIFKEKELDKRSNMQKMHIPFSDKPVVFVIWLVFKATRAAAAFTNKYANARPERTTDNPFIESFNGSLRDECLNTNWFLSLQDAADKIESWRRDYNGYRPHSSLQGLTPDQICSEMKNKSEISIFELS